MLLYLLSTAQLIVVLTLSLERARCWWSSINRHLEQGDCFALRYDKLTRSLDGVPAYPFLSPFVRNVCLWWHFHQPVRSAVVPCTRSVFLRDLRGL